MSRAKLIKAIFVSISLNFLIESNGSLTETKKLEAVNNLMLPAQDVRSEVRNAVDGAANQLQKNLIVILNELARDSFKLGRTVKFGINSLVNGLVNGTFNIATIVVSTPKLLTEELPSQLLTVLKEMQKDRNLTTEYNTTISNIVQFITDAETSGVSQNVLRPVTNVLPNLLTGVNRFLIAILDGMFYLIGARDPNTYYYGSSKYNKSGDNPASPVKHKFTTK